MRKSINAYEAPALLDAHPTMSRLALYERLTGGSDSSPQAGLASYIAEGAIDFVAADNGWTKGARYDFVKRAADGLAIDGTARGWRMTDRGGEFVAVFVHLAQFMHAQAWGKAGVPPEAFLIQANWTMFLADAPRLAFVVLADRRIVIYWVDRDEDIVGQLKAGVTDLARRIADKDAPPVDAVRQAAPTPTPVADAAAPDMDDLCTRWRAAQIARADQLNRTQTAEHAYDAATEALKRAIAPGSSHVHEGVRIHHNAKNSRLTEEKIDGAYF